MLFMFEKMSGRLRKAYLVMARCIAIHDMALFPAVATKAERAEILLIALAALLESRQ